MKKLILIFFPFLFVSCSVKHKKTFDYIFNKTEAITLEQSKLTLSKDITVLSFSDSSMVDRNSSIIKVDSGWIVYSKNSESSILSFTSDFPVISDTGEMALVNILASMMSLLIRKVKF